MKLILCSLFTFLIIKGYSQADNPSKIITGNIYSSIDPQLYNLANIDIILRCNNKVFDTVQTNDKGHFSIKIPHDKQRKIDILYSGIGFGPVYLRYLNLLSTDTTNLQIDVGKNYRKNIYGTAICPKCNKTNRVYKVSYGEAPVYVIRISEKGDTTYSPLYKGTYQAGTGVSTVQSAEWYCDRDKIEF